MEKILRNIGLSQDETRGKKRRLYFIPNPDGSPRWIWNSENTRPDFLKFYTANGLRSIAFDLAIRLIFWLKLQHVVFGRKSVQVWQAPDHALNRYTGKDFAVFTGTAGPNRKLVLYGDRCFIKISLNRNSFRLVEKERSILGQISSGRNFETPKCQEIEKGTLLLSDMGGGSRMGSFSDLHAIALTELYLCHPHTEQIFGLVKSFSDSWANISHCGEVSSHLLPTYLRKKLDTLAQQVAGSKVLLGFAHGDFTPWNCFVSEDRIKLYDLELASFEMPFGFDAFHFVMQQGILVEHLSFKEIKPRLIEAFRKISEGIGMLPKDAFETHFKAYLLINSSYYLGVYAKQANWHIQINWLLRTWNDAVSDMLANVEEPRSLLIGDIFDFLQNHDYAAVKFPNIDPRDLSQNTDIDLLMSKDLAIQLCNWIGNQSLVHRLRVETRSNMRSVLVVLVDGSMLALDLVWKLKRKHLEFMSVPEVLTAAVVNEFGVKVPTIGDLRAYLVHFYGLNGAVIPARYQHIFDCGGAQIIQFESLIKSVRNFEKNKSMSGFVNTLNYVLDTFRMVWSRKGLILTFSGVDGAGKSTVIEHTKLELEKRFRKRVVVIRHRPSVLPILSAWTKGKEKAEQLAASTLPRQGSNKSLLSSMARFGYYYADYLFGQFYIYMRYVRTGSIVLYDRYYFDFINDSLRSNILLPKWFTKMGYKFLLKPNLNFFLYADAPIILSRKKELDAAAITQLTSDYIRLFAELNKGDRKQYFAIENIHLTDTIDFITSKTQSQLV